MVIPRISVRAIAITPDGQLCVIKRERPGAPAYYVLPGGGLEDSDRGLSNALERELHEELAATGTIRNTVFIVSDWHSESPSLQVFKLVSSLTFSGKSPQGPEYRNPNRGSYTVITFPLTSEMLNQYTVKPDAAHDFIKCNLNALLWLAQSDVNCTHNEGPNSRHHN